MGRVLHATKIDTAGVDLSWLSGRVLVDVSWSDPLPWLFSFDDGTRVSVECSWRVLQDEQIALSDADHRQKYGLPALIDAVAEARALLSGGVVSKVALSEGTLDLSFTFFTGVTLQIIPFFRGYECWQISSPGRLQLVAMAGAGVSTYPE
jgi:hypothetical protein